jgi:transposase InsO family protein
MHGHSGDEMAARPECRPNLHQAGQPMAKRVLESCNGKLRDECLNREWFLTRWEAKIVIEKWRQFYNNERPHSALGNHAFADALG